jgi:hypothetical protein
MPKRSSVQIISPTLGVIRNEPLEAAVVAIELLQDPGEQACDQAVEEDSLGQCESEPLDARDFVAHLWLARNGLNHLSEDDPDADAGPEGAQAAADPDSKAGADTGRDVKDGG